MARMLLNSKAKFSQKGVQNMKRKIGTAMLVGLFLVGLTSLAYSWGGPGGFGYHGRGPSWGGTFFDLRVIPDLKLTPEQETKIDALRMEHLRDIKPLEEKMFSLSRELRLLWLERVPDEAKINAVEKELRSVRDQIWDKTTAYMIKVKGILTPEQQQKLSAYRWFSQGRMGPGRSSFGPGPCWR